MKMLKNLTPFLFFLFSITAAFAQEEFNFSSNTNYAFLTEKETTEQPLLLEQSNSLYQKHWSFGGSLGMSFWNGGTSILIGPKAYYNFSPKFLTGIGVSYMYSEYKNQNYTYHSNSFGGSVMAAVRPIHFLQISAEYEGLQTNYSGFYTDKYFVNALYFGLSYVTGPVSFGIRYDVLFDSNTSIYSSAWNPYVGFYF